MLPVAEHRRGGRRPVQERGVAPHRDRVGRQNGKTSKVRAVAQPTGRNAPRTSRASVKWRRCWTR
jgi:hypothetical protein